MGSGIFLLTKKLLIDRKLEFNIDIWCQNYAILL